MPSQMSLWDLPVEAEPAAPPERVVVIQALEKRIDGYSTLAMYSAETVMEYLNRLGGEIKEYMPDKGRSENANWYLYTHFSGASLQEGVSALISGKKVKFIGRAG